MMLALIAGTGDLPAVLVDRLRAANRSVLICELAGFVADLPAGLPRLAFRMETLGTFLAMLRDMGVTEVCMAGAVRRPDIDPSLVDAATHPLVGRLSAAMGMGDDAMLRIIITIIEDAGLRVIGADTFAPDLLQPTGVPTVMQPDTRHRSDADFATGVIATLGQSDQGQACVVKYGQVLAREARGGTDAMLTALCAAHETTPMEGNPLLWAVDLAADLVADAADWLSGQPTPDAKLPGRGAVLFKAAKPGQDRRVDLPTIGPATALRSAEAGLDGIIITAGDVMVLDAPEVVQILDANGMFIWVRQK
jgi:hypothetical protein